MSILKKLAPRGAAVFLAVVMCVGMMVTPAMAADVQTVTVSVFSVSSGSQTLGSFTVKRYSPQSYYSETYQIPSLDSWLPAGATYGRVQKVTGNFMDKTEAQPGAEIAFGMNNSGTMTYWVDWFNLDGGSSSLWNFTLNYNANGGDGAPASQTYGTSSKYEKSHTFTLSNTVPSREGYTFKGWSDNPGASNSVNYNPGGTCLVSQTASGYNGGSVTKTIYAVWEDRKSVV